MNKKQKKELVQILAAIVIFFIFMIIEHLELLPIVFEHKLISFLVYLIPYLLCGRDIVYKAILGVIHKQPFDECFLMTIATIGAFVTGENSEAVAVMAFYQVGEWFQRYAVARSRTSITELMNIVPEYANLELEDGSIEQIDPDDVEIGNILVIKPGEKIPVDGIIVSGTSMIQTAALTGESIPRDAKPQDEVISGCVNGEGLLRIQATKTFDDSTVTKILELVENASEKKSRTENFITRFARYYTPIVVYGALLLAIIGSVITRMPMVWIYRACTFLVISCPCALVISIPLSFFGGIGAAGRNGVLVKGSNYLELLASVDTLVSDKTGTLTKGNFTVSSIHPAKQVKEEDVLYYAGLAETMSTHPIAKSISDALFASRSELEKEAARHVTDSENVTGQGLIATVDAHTVLVGSQKLMDAHDISFTPIADAAAAISYVAMDGSYLGAVCVRDEIKEDTPAAIADLKRQGVRRTIMLTGDRDEVAQAVGRDVGVDEVFSELLPQDKVAKVEELLRATPDKHYLAFVGDGINDAPVLMRADIGIAMGSLGSDAAIEAADVVIMDDNISRIPTVIGIARKTIAIANQNIVFALSVKLLILILGAIGIANMWAAVFADVGVAVLCILNSLRLLRIGKTI